MEAISYTAFRNKLAEKMKEICNNHIGLIVTRQNAESVVVLSLEDYHAIEETAYLVKSPQNALRLVQALEEIEKGFAKEKELLE